MNKNIDYDDTEHGVQRDPTKWRNANAAEQRLAARAEADRKKSADMQQSAFDRDYKRRSTDAPSHYELSGKGIVIAVVASAIFWAAIACA